jgi:hypothetical protein
MAHPEEHPTTSSTTTAKTVAPQMSWLLNELDTEDDAP